MMLRRQNGDKAISKQRLEIQAIPIIWLKGNTQLHEPRLHCTDDLFHHNILHIDIDIGKALNKCHQSLG